MSMREFPGLIKVDFAEFLRQLRRNWLWVLLVPLVAVGAAFGLSQLPTKQYEAVARLLAAQPTSFQGNTGNLGQTSAIDSEAYREAALSSQVLKKVFGANVNLEQLRRIIRVRTVDGRQSGIVLLNVRRPDPEQAAKEANSWALALRDWDNSRVRESYTRNRAVIESQLNTVRADIARGGISTENSEALRSLQGQLLRDRDAIRVGIRVSVIPTVSRPGKDLLPQYRPTGRRAGVAGL